MTTGRKLYIFAGGGSGGHLYPGLAVAEALQELESEAEVLFLATGREIDRQILQKKEFDYEAQPIVPLPNPKKPGQAFNFYRSWRASIKQCEELMRRKRPAVVLGLGGFASGPAMKVAAKLGIPAAMLNPDAIPGKANRFCRKYADKIFLQWQVSEKYFGKDRGKCVVTGCPIRKEIVERGAWSVERKRITRRQLGLVDTKRLLVVMGGSQGGRNVNKAVVRCLTVELKSADQAPCAGGASPTLQDPSATLQVERRAWPALQEWQVLHLTGSDDKEWVEKEYTGQEISAQVWAFTDRMELVLGAADLVIARAGASSLAELTAAGVASILLPYPYHKDQHQLHNAQVLVQAGAAMIVFDERDAQKTSKSLTRVLVDGINDDKLSLMAQAARGLGKPKAAELVAEWLMGKWVDE